MTVQAIKLALKKLPLAKRLEIVHWVTTSAEKDDWDQQMDADAADGKLDFLIKEAKDAAKKGRLKPFPRP
jgi:hypothetical protein